MSGGGLAAPRNATAKSRVIPPAWTVSVPDSGCALPTTTQFTDAPADLVSPELTENTNATPATSVPPFVARKQYVAVPPARCGASVLAAALVAGTLITSSICPT